MKQVILCAYFVLLMHNAFAQRISTVYTDKEFTQEYHEAYPVGDAPAKNNVRSIAVDRNSNVWIANEEGIFVKHDGERKWLSLPFSEKDKGPAYAVVTDSHSTVWMGTWNGVYIFSNGELKKIPGTQGPVSLICNSREGVYALGPGGIWLYHGNSFFKTKWQTARSLRSVISDGSNGLWVASEVGLYHCSSRGVKHYHDTASLISASLKGVAFGDSENLWVAGLGGVTILKEGIKNRVITTQEGSPSNFTSSVKRSPDGVMWVGTNAGVVRYAPDGTHTLRFSRRWLMDDHVNDIAFDAAGNAWIATDGGVSAIKKREMNLAAKQEYFYDVLMRRHIRKPWISGQCRLAIAGDTTSWQPEDDDNDGEYGGNYLTMECFRYAVTKNEDAHDKASKAFLFLKQLREITEGDGYFARTIVPSDWTSKLHDGNRKYTEAEKADELVKEPRFKPVETRWRKSRDGQWLWKGDASSDEWCGHMMGYFFYYQLVANDSEKVAVRDHVSKLVDHLIANDYNMMDIDGTPTRWSVWSPSLLNGDPEWAPDQSENSMELLTFLKLAYFMTGNMKYQQHYLELIGKHHYLDNMSKLTQQNPAWFVYYDVIMQCYLYPILIGCEKDPKLKAWYEQHMDNWMKKRVDDHNPQINFLYCYSRNKKIQLKNSIDFLTDTPLDLVCWYIDHTKREDIKIVHQPDLSEFEVNVLPPASIRATVRWDANPWLATSGNPEVEREPVFWLLPYWIGRYLKMIN
ncbi:MAG: regulator [Chitinophagaceae bacterium]|nr:regulator [Chitinophagaceae bacterium]